LIHDLVDRVKGLAIYMVITWDILSENQILLNL